VAARLGDGLWTLADPDTAPELIDAYKQACDEAGKEPGEIILQSGFSWAEDDEAALEGARVWKATLPGEYFTDDWSDPQAMYRKAEEEVSDEDFLQSYIVSSSPDEHVERVLATTLEQAPPNATHWSTRLLARQLGMSQTAVSRIWRAFALQPHRSEAFKLSRDPQFVEKVRDVVGLYLAPPDRALVLCVDEKTQIQAREPTGPVLPMRPGQLERHTHDYVRHGTRDLFAALDVKAGTVIGETHRRHRSVEFRKFLDTIDAAVPGEFAVHLVLDNSVIHKTAAIHRWLAKRPRYRVHFTPTSASWLNLVECWFSLLQRRELSRGVYRSTYALEHGIRRYIAQSNAAPQPFVWTKTADEILENVARFCQRTSNSHH
jgi:transposase